MSGMSWNQCFLLSPEHAESSVGCALAADAARAMDRIDIDQHFSIRPSRWSWLPLLPATFVLLAALWMDPLRGGAPGACGKYQALAPDATQQRMDAAAKVLRKQLTEHRNEAAKQSLKDAESLFRDLEKEVEQLQVPLQSHDRKDRLVKLSDLSRQLADWRRQAGGEGALRKEFEKMKNVRVGRMGGWRQTICWGRMARAFDLSFPPTPGPTNLRSVPAWAGMFMPL